MLFRNTFYSLTASGINQEISTVIGSTSTPPASEDNYELITFKDVGGSLIRVVTDIST